MTSLRRSALVAGVFYLITFISSIPAWFLLQPVLSNPEYVVSAGADTQVTFGAFLDLVTAFAGIGTAVALYSVVKRQHEGFALGFVTTRLVEGAVILIGAVSLLAVVSLRQAAPAAGEAGSMIAAGRALVAVHDWTYLFGPGLMPVLNALMLGTVLYRSRLVPRIIPALGLIGAPLLFSSTIGTMFGVNDTQSAWTGVATMPIFFWELSVGLWMTFKGFNRFAPAALAHAAAEDAKQEGSLPALAPAATAAPAAGTA